MPQPALNRPAPASTPLAAKPAAVTPSRPATAPLAGGLGAQTDSAHEKLSKADKKALRKRLLEMRQARQQRDG